MAKAAGILLRTLSTVIRFIQFLAALAILGIFSYFLAVLSRNNLDIPTRTKAVEGLAGAGTLYALIGFLLTCCLGGFTFFAFLAIVLDILFIGAFIAVAVLTRGSVTNCDPLGSQDSTGPVTQTNQGYAPDLGMTCRLEKACFILAVVLAVLFLVSAIFQLFLGRHHQREKRQPNYSRKSSSMAPIWSRKKKDHNATPNAPMVASEKKPPFWKRNKKAPRDTEYAAAGAGAGLAAGHHQTTHDMRPSHDSRMTDNTMVAPGQTTTSEYKPYKPNHNTAYREPGVIDGTATRDTAYNTSHTPHVNSTTSAVSDSGYPYNTPEAANAAYEGRNIAPGHTSTNY